MQNMTFESYDTIFLREQLCHSKRGKSVVFRIGSVCNLKKSGGVRWLSEGAVVLVVHRFSLQCMHVRRRSISKSTYYRMDHFRITSYSHFVVGVCPDLLFTCRTPQYSLTLNLAPLVGYYMCSRFDQKLIQPGQQQDRNQLIL